MISHRLPPTTTTHNQTSAPLKIANVTAAPSDKKSAGRRTPARLTCPSQCALSYEHLLLLLFFFTVRYASRVPVPPSTKLTPHPTCTTSPAPQHLPFQAAQTVKPASCRRSVQNCRSPKPNAIALLLSTHPQHTRVEDIDGRVGGGWRWVAKTTWNSRRRGLTVSSVSREVSLQILAMRLKRSNTLLTSLELLF